jgi:hypothetical protein
VQCLSKHYFKKITLKGRKRNILSIIFNFYGSDFEEKGSNSKNRQRVRRGS